MDVRDLYSDYHQCSFDNWSANFKEFLHENIILTVPIDVVKYLHNDIMVLPQNSLFSRKDEVTANGFWSTAEDELEEPNFFEFDEKIKKAIKQLGGKVFIKLNWSAPKDASWITSTRSLCCSDPSDIYLLLKSSTCISDDLSWLHKESESINPNMCCLVLKKWEEIHPGTEFRCFIMNKKLLGICQRDGTSYFKYINDSKEEIVNVITNFYLNQVKKKFNLNSYTFDVVITPGKKVILLDIGVLNKDTECLFFSFEELERKVKNHGPETGLRNCPNFEEEKSSGLPKTFLEIESGEKVEFQFVDEHTDVIQNKCKHYGIPIDVIHFCRDKKSVMDFIEDEVINQKS